MAQRKTLTLAQISVLRWVGDGCPDDQTDDVGRRISVAALRNRALVTTEGAGQSWRAAITTKGQAHLDEADGDAPPTPRVAASVTEQLISDILAAGGTLRVQRTGYGQTGVVDYEQRAQAAVRHGRVPDGKRLVLGYPESGYLRLSLIDGPDELRDLAPVQVPSRVARYHEASHVIRDDHNRLGLSRDSSRRAARILHTLATAAEGHGFTIATPSTFEPYYSRSRSTHRDSFVFRKSTCDLELRIREAKDESGRLTIELPGWSRAMGPSSWGDRKSWRLEDKLTDVLRELLVRAADHEDREAEKKREAERRQIAWNEAMVVARRRHAEAHRAKVLLDEVAAWETAGRVRAYATAIATRLPDDPEASAWATWAVDHADSLDPFSTPVRFPADPQDPSADDLRPYLGRWSPYGPEGYR